MLDTSASSYCVTGASDKQIKTFDLFRSFKPLTIMMATDAVMCGETLEHILIVGSADGNILCFNLETGECLYGYGVDQKGAVHCLAINAEKDCIVTGGDSGLGLCLNMV